MRYLEARDKALPGAWCLLGAGLDITGSYKLGAAGGPAGLREASDNLEDYCPVSDKLIQDTGFGDVGDLDLTGLDSEAAVARIREGIRGLVDSGVRPFLLGGEHTVTVPALQVMAQRHPDLVVIQFDAHADLRETYHDTPLSHACVMMRAAELLGPDRIHQIGIRSGTREEWAFMRTHRTLVSPSADGIRELIRQVGDAPVYLTLDLDVLDPSILAGTGTPEPQGLTFRELDDIIRALACLNVVAADVVELAPSLDPTGVSVVTAAKIVRTMILEL